MKNRLVSGLAGGLAAVFAAGSWAYPSDPCAVASTDCQTIVVAGGDLATRASFQISAGTLTVTLSNISGSDVLVPADVLTALFFDLEDTSGNLVTLAPVSATTDGETFLNGVSVQPDGTNVGGEWAYGSLTDLQAVNGLNQGISSAGFGLFGDGNFNGPDLDDPTAVNGLNYGILSAGDNVATGNNGVLDDPLTKDTVVFTLSISGTPTIDLSKSGSLTIAAQYGTALNEPRLPPSLPVPGTAALLALGALMLPIASRMSRKRS